MQLSAITPVTATPVPSAPPAAQQPVAPSAPPAAVPDAAPQEASLGARLLGRMGSAQQGWFERQQVVGAITTLLGARLSMVGERLVSTLRGM